MAAQWVRVLSLMMSLILGTHMVGGATHSFKLFSDLHTNQVIGEMAFSKVLAPQA